MSWQEILKGKYDSDTQYTTFNHLHELISAMMRDNVKNAKGLRHIYHNVSIGKIVKGKEKEYLLSFATDPRNYVTRKHGIRRQWIELVEQGEF